jgi:conjugation system TraG family ATPase
MLTRTINIEERIPFAAVEHDSIVGGHGDISQVLQLSFPVAGTMSAEMLENIHQTLVRCVKLLGSGWVLHQQSFVTAQIFSSDGSAGSYLQNASNSYFAGRSWFDVETYLILTKRISAPGNSAGSNLFRSPVPAATSDPNVFSEIISKVQQVIAVLTDGGVRASLLHDEELLSTATRVGLLERYSRLSKDLLLRDVHMRSGVAIGEQTLQVFNLCDADCLPALCGPMIKDDSYSTERSTLVQSFSHPLYLGLACAHVTNVVIETLDPREVMQTMERRLRRLHSLSAYSKDNAVTRDAVAAFIHEASAEQRIPVRFGCNVMTIAKNEAEKEAQQKMISSAFAKLDATAKLETVGAPQLYWACYPGNACFYPTNDTVISFAEPALCFFNTASTQKEDAEGPVVRFTQRASGQPINVDLCDGPMQRGEITNRNMAVFGPSGSGKSFFTNHLVRSLYDAGAHVLIIDIGHSYEHQCKLHGGYYFTYAADKPIAFNPFYLGDEKIPDTEKKESIITLLLALWKKDDEPFSRSEYVVLSNAIDGFYRACGESLADFNLFYTYFKNDFAPALTITEFNVNGFLYVLAPYAAGGTYDFLLNAHENLDLLEKRFIVFELDNIKDHPVLLPVVTIIIMETFIAKMRRLKGERKVMLIEEAWKAIARNGMAEYIKYLFKTVRKFFGQAVIVTQEIDDIIHSQIVKHSIINNADIKVLLDQRKYQNRFEPVAQLLGLNETERAMALSLNRANDPTLKYKEVFISLGGQFSSVYRVEVSPAEYLCYTTEEKEKMKVAQAGAQSGSIEEAIESLLKQKR